MDSAGTGSESTNSSEEGGGSQHGESYRCMLHVSCSGGISHWPSRVSKSLTRCLLPHRCSGIFIDPQSSPPQKVSTVNHGTADHSSPSVTSILGQLPSRMTNQRLLILSLTDLRPCDMESTELDQRSEICNSLLLFYMTFWERSSATVACW